MLDSMNEMETPPTTPTIKQQHYMTLKSTASNLFSRFKLFLRHYYNKNRKTLLFTILTYLSDLFLFFSINFYLFTNNRYLFVDEPKTTKQLQPNTTTTTTTTSTTAANYTSTTLNAFPVSTTIELINRIEHLLTTTTSIDTLATSSANNLYTNSNLNSSNIRRSVDNSPLNTDKNQTIFLSIFKHELQQSYLSLQIITIFIFFFYFILNILLKILFKYHKYEIRVYKNSINNYIEYDERDSDDSDDDNDDINNNKDNDDNDDDASHKKENGSINRQAKKPNNHTGQNIKTYSVSMSSTTTNKSRTKKYVNLLIRNVIFKDSSVILNFYLGYQYCQNIFLNSNSIASILILITTAIKIIILYLKEYFRFKQTPFVKQNETIADNHVTSHTGGDKCWKRRLKTEKKFNLINVNNLTLYLGFIGSLFHLFAIHIAFSLIFIFIQLLIIIVLLRFKTYLYAFLSLFIYIICIYKYINNTDTHMYKFNIVVFVAYLVLLYVNIIINNYFKFFNLSRLERWNRKFLCKNNFKRKFYVLVTFACNLIFIVVCVTIMYRSNSRNFVDKKMGSNSLKEASVLNETNRAERNFLFQSTFESSSKPDGNTQMNLSVADDDPLALDKNSGPNRSRSKRLQPSKYDENNPRQKHPYELYYYLNMFMFIPLFIIISVIWIIFQFANTINLWFLMNKITECYEIASNTLIKANSRDDRMAKRGLLNDNTSLKHGSSSSNTSPENTFDNKITNYVTPKSTKALAPLPITSTPTAVSFRGGHLFQNLRNFISKSNENEKKFRNMPLKRIMSFKGIRYISSISYRICFICTFQTLLLLVFIFYTHSAFIISLYLFIFNINLLWLNLLDCLSSIISGTCISYSLVVPVDQNGGSQAHYNNRPQTNSRANTSFMSFNYQQEIGQRCTYLLNKIYEFLQFYLIENFGCDYSSTGLNRDSFESKLRAFFMKTTLDGPRYNTYFLYYCGPTSKANSLFQLHDGGFYSIESIIDIWKEIHCKSSSSTKPISVKNKNYVSTLSTDSDSDDNPHRHVANPTVPSNNLTNSRLILVIDTQYTDLMVDYVSKKLQQKHLYVALQTVNYEKKDEKIGQFTIDWIRYNCKLYQNLSNCMDGLDTMEKDDVSSLSDAEMVFHNNGGKSSHQYIKINDDDNYEEDLTKKKQKKDLRLKNTDVYKTKCAFSKHWNSYTFESNTNKMDAIDEINQYWKLYYPRIFQPLLKIINCRFFYHKFKLNFLHKFLCYYKSMKHFFLPQVTKEYDTGHGFKLISS